MCFYLVLIRLCFKDSQYFILCFKQNFLMMGKLKVIKFYILCAISDWQAFALIDRLLKKVMLNCHDGW